MAKSTLQSMVGPVWDRRLASVESVRMRILRRRLWELRVGHNAERSILRILVSEILLHRGMSEHE